MGAHYHKSQQGRAAVGANGFTVIEVVLFLGISGMLAVGLLGGWTTMINTQRYKDTAKTLQSFIQQQYNLVYNVENGRSPALSCSGSNVDEIGAANPRGQSSCILMGRFIEIQNGTALSVRAIVGQDLSEDNDATNDIDLIKDSAPELIPADIDIGLTFSNLTVPWGGTIVDDGGSPETMYVAIIRSPVSVSGAVHTYSTTSFTTINDMVAVANENRDVPLCIDPGNNFSGGRIGVAIKARASAQSYVQIITDDEDVC